MVILVPLGMQLQIEENLHSIERSRLLPSISTFRLDPIIRPEFRIFGHRPSTLAGSRLPLKILLNQSVGRNNRRALRRMSIIISQRHLLAPCPVRGIHTLLNQTVKSRIRPVTHAPYQAVFDRVDVHVVHMNAIVSFIANQMFPEPPFRDRE